MATAQAFPHAFDEWCSTECTTRCLPVSCVLSPVAPGKMLLFSQGSTEDILVQLNSEQNLTLSETCWIFWHDFGPCGAASYRLKCLQMGSSGRDWLWNWPSSSTLMCGAFASTSLRNVLSYNIGYGRRNLTYFRTIWCTELSTETSPNEFQWKQMIVELLV